MRDELLTTVSGQLVLSDEIGDSLRNAVLLSINTRKGALVSAEWFGSTLHEVKSTNSEGVISSEKRVKDCLRWLVDTDRVSRIDVSAKRNAESAQRIDISGTMYRGQSSPISFQTFFEVV